MQYTITFKLKQVEPKLIYILKSIKSFIFGVFKAILK